MPNKRQNCLAISCGLVDKKRFWNDKVDKVRIKPILSDGTFPCALCLYEFSKSIQDKIIFLSWIFRTSISLI